MSQVFQGFDKSVWPDRQFGKKYIFDGLSVPGKQARDDLWRKWFAWMEPRMRSSGLLDAGGFNRAEESEKTSSIVAEFIQVFAADFNSQQPPTEWRLQAAKGVASAVKGTKRIKNETTAAKAESLPIEPGRPRDPRTELNLPTDQKESASITESSQVVPVTRPERMTTSIEDEEPTDFYEGPLRPFNQTTVTVSYGSPNSSVYQVYSAYLLQKYEPRRPIAELDVEDMSFEELVHWLKEDSMFFDDQRHSVVYGPARKPATILNNRHFHCALRLLLGAHRISNHLWVKVREDGQALVAISMLPLRCIRSGMMLMFFNSASDHTPAPKCHWPR